MWILAFQLMQMQKSRFSIFCSGTEMSDMWGTSEVFQLFTAVSSCFFRYYDNKRSAEKKEHKTIEAADKVE